MENETLVIYDGRKDPSKRQWYDLQEAMEYIAEDIDDKNYILWSRLKEEHTRYMLGDDDYDPQIQGCIFPKRFFYDVRQYIHLIPEKLLKQEIDWRKGIRKRKDYTGDESITLVIYNGRKNRNKNYCFKCLEKGKAYPARYSSFGDIYIYKQDGEFFRFPAEFFFDIREYMHYIPIEIIEAEKARRKTIKIIAKYFIGLPYDYEWDGVKFKEKLIDVENYLNFKIKPNDGDVLNEVDTTIVDMTRTTSKIIDNVIKLKIDSPLDSQQIECLKMLGQLYSINQWIKFGISNLN